jgi:hypothetical protein
VEWKILDGLSGEGPNAIHFFADRPSPWREGTVIEFSYAGASKWIGNFASVCRRPAEILHWPGASLILVLIGQDLYLIDEDSPDRYKTQTGVNNFLVDASGQLLFVADHARVRAYGTDRKLRWETGPLGGYDANINRIHAHVLEVDIEVEMEEPRRILHIRCSDGLIESTK